MKLETVLGWAIAEKDRVTVEADDNAKDEATLVIEAVREALSGFTDIKDAKDLFECCEILDRLPVDSKLTKPFDDIRSRLLLKAFQSLHREKSAQITRGDVDLSLELSNKRLLWTEVARLIQVLKQKNPENFGPSWIQINARPIFDRILPLIKNKNTQQPDWDEVRMLLPEAWASKFLSERALSKDEILSKSIQQYREIAEALGPEALAEFLVIVEGGHDKKFSELLNIIVQYLGRSANKGFNFHKFSQLPEAALKLEGFKKLVFVNLRNHIYRKLRGSHDDEAKRTKLKEVYKAAIEVLSPEKEIHRKLLKEVVDYFKNVLAQKAPPRMVNKLRDKKGHEHEVPSLRQKMAMTEIVKDADKEKNGRLMVCFGAGKGKTLTAFLAKEHVGAKKLLYLCPNTKLAHQTQERVSKYYKKGQDPTVGKIVAEMSHDEILAALDAEVVVMPFSMFGSKRNGTSIIELHKAQNFDMAVVDEAHNARNEEGLNTQTVYELLTQIPGLYDDGHIMLLTADPVPRSPEDIVVQLRIFDKNLYGEVGSLREAIKKSDPLKLRNSLLDFMLIPDEPEDWEQFVEQLDLHLSDEEMNIYTTLLEDENIPLTRKIEVLRLAILNPGLFDASFQKPGTMAEELSLSLEEDFENEWVAMVAEPTYKGGVIRPHQEQPEVPTFFDNVKALLSKNSIIMDYDSKFKNREELMDAIKEAKEADKEIIICAAFDGETAQADREDILALSKEAKALGIKVLIFAMSPIIREGIDLSHINNAYMLAPEFNHPDLYQHVKRYRRESNTTAKLRVFNLTTLITEGIHLHAKQKAVLCDRLKYGGTLVEAELAAFNDDLDESVRIDAGHVIFGTPITDKLLSERQKLRRLDRHLHNKGEAENERVMATYGQEYAKMFARNWESSFSSSNGRYVSGLIQELMRENALPGSKIADVYCGPTVLANTLGVEAKGLEIDSFDSNKYMLDEGTILQAKRGADVAKNKTYVSGMTSVVKNGIPVAKETYDCVNLADAIQFTNLNANRNISNDERAATLIEQNRILKTGGTLIITLPFHACSPEEFDQFSKELENFGFKLVEKYTGCAKAKEAGSNFCNYTIVCKKVGSPNPQKINLKNLKLTPILAPEHNESKKVHASFQINKSEIGFLTEVDKKALIKEEEKKRKIEAARKLLNGLWQKKGRTLTNLSAEERDFLAENGLKLFRPTTSKEGWTFTISSGTDRYRFLPS